MTASRRRPFHAIHLVAARICGMPTRVIVVRLVVALVFVVFALLPNFGLVSSDATGALRRPIGHSAPIGRVDTDYRLIFLAEISHPDPLLLQGMLVKLAERRCELLEGSYTDIL